MCPWQTGRVIGEARGNCRRFATHHQRVTGIRNRLARRSTARRVILCGTTDLRSAARHFFSSIQSSHVFEQTFRALKQSLCDIALRDASISTYYSIPLFTSKFYRYSRHPSRALAPYRLPAPQELPHFPTNMSIVYHPHMMHNKRVEQCIISRAAYNASWTSGPTK